MSTNWNFGPGHTNNGSVGFGGGINGVAQGIYEESSTQKAPLGAPLEFDDGRKFRYTKAGEAIGIGIVVANDHSAGMEAELDDFTVSATAGDKFFSLTGGGSEFETTAQFYAGSYIVFTDGTGAGQYYRIKDHSTASSDKITFQLYDSLATAPSTDTDILIVGNPYGSSMEAVATIAVASDSWAIGTAPIAVTSGYYFWAQTKGICAAKADYGTTAANAQLQGMQMVVSTSHDGQVEVLLDATDGHQVIGNYMTTAGDDNTYIAMNLTLE